MGGTYSAPAAEPMSDVLAAYEQYIPGIIGSASAQQPGAALNQFNSTLATQPLYNALNLQQLMQYGLPTAQAGQKISDSNAQAGAQTNLNQIRGAGGDVAREAYSLARETNPNYYTVQDKASQKASDLLSSINLGGLSPGEFNATERANNMALADTGNLGLNNSTNTISNALNFGGAFNKKLDVMGNALNAANGTATSAQNTGFNPVSLALGQPNTSTMGNFGTGTFSNTNAGTQNQSGTNAFGMGNSLLGNMTSMNNSATQGAYGLAAANAAPNYIPNISC